MYDAPIPQVGDPAHYYVGSDCYPCKVVAVSPSGHRLQTIDVDATPAPGYDHYSHQVYTYADYPDGDEDERTTFTRRADGRYRRLGCKAGEGYLLSIGKYHAYRDPSF